MTKQLIKKWTPICTLIGCVFLSSCAGTAPTQEISIIPLPASIQQTQGSFKLTSQSTIGVSNASLMPAAEYLSSILSPATGYNIQVKDGEGTINLKLQSDDRKEGSYRLVVDSKGVTISAGSYPGIISGIESLRQLFPAQIESKELVSATSVNWVIPTVEIEDEPRFEWRGIMLDVSRHFYTTTEVKELLDIMALYKMNKFHWHLSDDQGWRIEIKQYPLLTEKGAWRTYNSHDKECLRLARTEDNTDYLLPADRLRVEDGDTVYGGFYTQEEIKDIVAYAGVRGIDVIPEIDMPGHMLAAVSNYKGVACFDNTGWGTIFSSPVCPGKETAMEFCKNIYSEVIDLFPYEYVHIGGDEVEKTNWKKCPDCQKRMREHNLKTEEELQAWYIKDMEKFFTSKGKRMIGWDEIVEGGLSETATIMWWRSWSKDSPAKATQQGNRVIFTPNTEFYLDYKSDDSSLEHIYNREMTAEGVTPEQESLIMGVQGNIWCEWIPSRERMQYMATPRLLAIAELGWSQPSQKNWDAFKARITNQFTRLNVMGVNYNIPQLEGFNTTNAFIDESVVDVTCLDPSADIRYTTDGSIPTLQSTKYEGPFTITETTDFIFRTFRPNGKQGNMIKTRFVKSAYADATDVAPANEGLSAAWHDFKGNKCAEISDAKLNGTYPVSSVSIPEEVKGVIGLVITGYINIPQDDIYTFELLSDDGSILVIDNELVVDNDGAHSPALVIAQKALAKGYHPLEARYFDRNGGVLKLVVKGSDGKEIPNVGLYAY